MILDLDKFFQEFNHQIYCIIKPSKDLPSYKKGSDIDIFCYDIDKMTAVILNIGNRYIEKGLEIVMSNMNGQRYVDFIHSDTGEIEFRFDVYEVLPTYQKLLIKPAFFENVIENRKLVDLSVDCSIFIPNSIDDNILRYIEYQEWYGQRPDKIKHINYILESCTSKEKNIFLEKLHHYTALPPVESIYPLKQNRNYFIKSIARKVWSKLPAKVKSFIKKFM